MTRNGTQVLATPYYAGELRGPAQPATVLCALDPDRYPYPLLVRFDGLPTGGVEYPRRRAMPMDPTWRAPYWYWLPVSAVERMG